MVKYFRLVLIKYILYLKKYGQLGLGDSNNRDYPSPIALVININQISSGGYHSLELSKEGRVFSFGYNSVNFC
jgi:alpha-tubulin suppressor-like RCC1 family protein